MANQDSNIGCSDCFFHGTAFSETYEPKGTFKLICGVPVYVSQPISSSKLGSLLFLPDGFALASHNLFLADEYARQGYQVILVDYFEGDALPIIFMSYTPGTDIDSYDNLTASEKQVIKDIDMPAWLHKHNSTHIWSILRPLVRKLKEDLASDEKLFALGHCFGGKYAIALGLDSITAVVVFHPSFLEPGDLLDLKYPLLVGCAESDVFTPNLIADLLAGLEKSNSLYKLSIFGGTRHGFASRADTNDEIALDNWNQSFNDSLNWFSRF